MLVRVLGNWRPNRTAFENTPGNTAVRGARYILVESGHLYFEPVDDKGRYSAMFPSSAGISREARREPFDCCDLGRRIESSVRSFNGKPKATVSQRQRHAVALPLNDSWDAAEGHTNPSGAS